MITLSELPPLQLFLLYSSNQFKLNLNILSLSFLSFYFRVSILLKSEHMKHLAYISRIYENKKISQKERKKVLMND
jgi:hypothetical protein